MDREQAHIAMLASIAIAEHWLHVAKRDLAEAGIAVTAPSRDMYAEHAAIAFGRAVEALSCPT